MGIGLDDIDDLMGWYVYRNRKHEWPDALRVPIPEKAEQFIDQCRASGSYGKVSDGSFNVDRFLSGAAALRDELSDADRDAARRYLLVFTQIWMRSRRYPENFIGNECVIPMLLLVMSNNSPTNFAIISSLANEPFFPDRPKRVLDVFLKSAMTIRGDTTRPV